MQKELNLVQKIAAISGKLGAISKEKQKDSKLDFGYQRIDDVVNAINPLMAEAGIISTVKVLSKKVAEQEITDRYGNLKTVTKADVDCEITITDGTAEISTQESAIKADYSDKAVTQAISMCYKYALIRLFKVRTKDTIDPDEPMTDHYTERKSDAKKTDTNNGKDSLEYLKNTFLAELNNHGMQSEFQAKVREYQNEKFLFWKNAINKQEALSIIITELKRLRGHTN